MVEKISPTIEELLRRIEELERATKTSRLAKITSSAGKYKIGMEEKMKENPWRSVGAFFLGGAVVGLLLGLAVAKRSKK